MPIIVIFQLQQVFARICATSCRAACDAYKNYFQLTLIEYIRHGAHYTLAAT